MGMTFEPEIICPWCGSTTPPIPSTKELANIQQLIPQGRTIERHLKVNPAMCPDCHGIGGYIDWGYDVLGVVRDV